MGIDRIVLGTRKGLLILGQSDSWRVVHEGFPGVHVSIVFLHQPTGDLFACLDDGHFGTKLFCWRGFLEDENFRHRDPKSVWKELPTPKYPAGSTLADGSDAVLKYMWAMSDGGESHPDRLWMGTEPGGLFMSEDRGESFELNQGLWNHPSRCSGETPWFGGGRDHPGIHSVCVDPRNNDTVRIGISCAGVFQTDDDGVSWEPVNRGLIASFLPNPNAEVGQDPHLLVQCQSQPDILWQQNHCGIFSTMDGCTSWQDVSTKQEANFGFAIAVDPDDGQQAWVVPAESDQVRSAVDRKLCVCRTIDGGKSWTRFANGLPQEDCFDFAFRHCLIYQAGQLVMATACGSLYLSNDRGESWKALGEHLPPIYCVATV